MYISFWFSHLVRRIDPMKEVRAPVLLTQGRSIPTMNRPMIGPVITPVIRVPTSSMPGKYLKTYCELIFDHTNVWYFCICDYHMICLKLCDKSNKNT